MQANVRQNVVYASPKSDDERSGIAGACVRNLHLKIPALLDPYENPTERAYTGWPDRLYLIDADSKVRFKSEAGPFGFDPKQLAAVLRNS